MTKRLGKPPGVAPLVQFGQERAVKRYAVPVEFCLGDWLILWILHESIPPSRDRQYPYLKSWVSYMRPSALYISRMISSLRSREEATPCDGPKCPPGLVVAQSE